MIIVNISYKRLFLSFTASLNECLEFYLKGIMYKTICFICQSVLIVFLEN